MGIEKTHGRNYDLLRMLRAVEKGDVVLPEFQRNFLWDALAIKQLLATCLTGWPIGSLLLLPGSSEVFFRTRSIEGAPAARDDFQLVVLDGQQRLTSLYQALFNKGEYRYAVEFKKLKPGLNIEDLEDAIRHFSADFWERHYSNEQLQYGASLIPVSALRSAADFFVWRDKALVGRPLTEREALTETYVVSLSGIDRYELSAVVIDDTVHPEAIARIFERVNRLGEPLNTFDLMVAKSYRDDFNLRDQWEEAQKTYPRVSEFLRGDGLPILSVIALRVRNSLRQQDVLALTGAAVRDYWLKSVAAMDSAIQFLQEELFVLQPDWLPYKSHLSVLSCLALESPLGDHPDELKAWFWLSIFRGRYDVASNTRSVEDYAKLVEHESIFKGATFLSEELMLAVNRRQYGAMHRGLLCLYASADPRGLVDGEDLGQMYLAGHDIVPVSLLPRDERINGQQAHLLTLGMILSTRGNVKQIDDIDLSEIDTGILRSQLLSQVGKSYSSTGLLRSRLEQVAEQLANASGFAAMIRVGDEDSVS